MGLTNDIYEAMKTSMESDTELDGIQDNNLYNTAEGIANAVIDFLTKQTFTITEMKSILEVEEISTTGPLQADVLQTVTTAVGGNVVMGTKGVLIPKLNLKKRAGGQGGITLGRGHAYIGRNPVEPGKTNEEKTEVRLLEENIVKER